MDRNQKETEVGALKDKFDRMVSAVLLDFKGLDVEAVTKLRDEFRSAGVEYRVAKNTLIKNAIQGQAYAEGLGASLRGMTGIAWSFEDPSAAAKVVKAFRKDHEKLTVKAGLVEGQILSGPQVEGQLATMPGKDELRAMLLATFQAPSQQLVQQLNAAAQNFAYLLSAKKEAAGEGSGG
jgi:large subunit ribosomal protein L10